ncbi:hypothetical protein WDW86_01660 [Bdellovibrionota bacterium FG-2]
MRKISLVLGLLYVMGCGDAETVQSRLDPAVLPQADLGQEVQPAEAMGSSEEVPADPVATVPALETPVTAELPPAVVPPNTGVVSSSHLLSVREGSFDGQASVRPWSAWWYPIRERVLFEDAKPGNSPLEKWDRYVTLSQVSAGPSPLPSSLSASAKFERENIYDPNAVGWEGLCNAWALASVLEPEPVSAVSYRNVQFNVGDLKALLIKSYARVEGLTYLGQRFDGDRSSVFEDMAPQLFHQALKSEIIEKHKPIIIDKDPGIPVWNTPVWKAQLLVVADSADSHVMHVTAWIGGVSPFVRELNFVGTLGVNFQYTYDLYGEFGLDGSFGVTGGKWTGASEDDHPDFVTLVPDAKPVRKSRNPYVDPTRVDELMALQRGT